MYARDCVKISKHAEGSPDNLYDVVEFTLCTINMPLSRVITQRESIKEHGVDSKWLSKVKASGVSYAKINKETLHYDVLKLRDKYGLKLAGSYRAVDHFMQIPSIGMVKAGFIAQMCGFNVACLDRHNIRSFGLDERALKVSKGVKHSLRLAKVKAYTKLCQKDGAEFWWDYWCNNVAEMGGMNKSLPTGDAVSEYHVKAIMEI